MTSAHNAATQLALNESCRRHSDTDGNIEEVEEYGLTYDLDTSNGAITCDVAPPTVDGQRLRFCLQTGGNAATLDFIGALSGANHTAAFSTEGEWLIVESFDVGGTLTWKAIANEGIVFGT